MQAGFSGCASHSIFRHPLFRRGHLPRAALYCLVCLIALVTLFVSLQTATLAFTRDTRIIKTLTLALQEGVFDAQNFPTSVYGHKGLDYDMFTDCIAMSTNLGNEGAPLLRRVAATPYHPFLYEGRVDPCQAFVAALKQKNVYPAQPYFRYWHGHQIYLRPLLANTSLGNVHILNATLLIAALGWFLVLMSRYFGTVALPLVLGPLIAGTNILTVPASTVHALSWIWAFLSLAVVTTWLARHDVNTPGSIALVFSMGCVAAFFDILFSPPFAPTFIMFLAIAFGLKRHARLRAAFDAGVLAVAWFAGFSLSWGSKWAFAAAVLGWGKVKANLINAIGVRSFGDPNVAESMQTLFAATQVVWSAQNPALLWGAVALALAILAGAVVLGGRVRSVLLTVVLLLTPLVIPVVWVEVLRDHSIRHPAFAARSFVLFAVIPLMAAVYVWPPGRIRDLYSKLMRVLRHPRTAWRNAVRNTVSSVD